MNPVNKKYAEKRKDYLRKKALSAYTERLKQLTSIDPVKFQFVFPDHIRKVEKSLPELWCDIPFQKREIIALLLLEMKMNYDSQLILMTDGCDVCGAILLNSLDDFKATLDIDLDQIGQIEIRTIDSLNGIEIFPEIYSNNTVLEIKIFGSDWTGENVKVLIDKFSLR